MVERLLAPGHVGRWFACLLLIAGSLLAGWKLPDLRLDRSDERLIGEDAEGWETLRAMERDFGADQGVLVYLRAETLWTTEHLKAIQDLGFKLEEIPGVSSVRTLLGATSIRDKSRYVDAGPLIDIVPKIPEALATAREDALYGPLIRDLFVSPDGNATSIALAYAPRPEDPLHELKMHAAIEDAIAPLRGQFQQVFQLGWPRLSAEIEAGLGKDLRRLTPLSVMILVCTVTLFLRSTRILPIPLVTAGLTILWTLGFMAAMDIPITLLTAILPALIIVVGSVEDVHLVANYYEGLEPPPQDARTRAIRHMAHHTGTAILITSLTTALGFASNVISNVPMIREFAVAASFAMAANLVITVAALPLLLHLMGPRTNPLGISDEVPRGVVGAVVRLIEKLSGGYPRLVIAAFALLLLIAGLQIPGLKADNDPMAYFHADHGFVGDADQVHRDLAGLKGFSVVMRAGTPGWFRTVEGLSGIARAQAVIEDQKIHDKTLSLADLMALMHREMHAGDPDFHVIPTTQQDFDLYLSSMPRSELEAFVSEDFSVARIQVRHNVPDSARVNAAADALAVILPAIFADKAKVEITGRDLLISRSAESLISGELVSLGLILVVIFLLFSFLYTSWHAGLLALVPNLIPLVLNFGAMAYLGVPLNPGTAMVATIAIGLAVDDTIHLMTRFGTESRQHLDEQVAVVATIRAEAVPVITTTIALGLGFCVFGLSSFRIVAEFGLLAAGTMLYAASSDLLLMPILLRNLRLATVWDIVKLEVDPAVLEGCPLFRDMSPYQIRKLILLSDMTDFAAGTDLMRQGEVSPGMYVLLRGRAEVAIEHEGSRLVVDQGGPGDIFGEIGFAGPGVPRTASIRAVTPVTAVKLDAARAHRGLRLYPRIATLVFRNISRLLGERLQASHERLLRAAGKD